MKSLVLRALAALIVVGGFAHTASASSISVGILSFDDIGGGIYTFDVTNLEPQVIVNKATMTLTVSKSGGGTFVLGGSKFTDDGFGDLSCTAAGDASTGGCDFASYDLLSATLTGTFLFTPPLTGYPGFSGILTSFSATLLPSSGNTLAPGDFTTIDATLVPTQSVPVPEPSTLMLMQLGIGALGSYKLRRLPLLRRFTARGK